jgi:hypothetical protein
VPSDYFTIEEFRELVGDTRSPAKFSETDVMEAQEDVIDRLEEWSHTAWQVRTKTISRYLGHPSITLNYVPIVEVTTLTADGSVVASTDYRLGETSGVLQWGGDWEFGPPSYVPRALVTVEFTYGYGDPDAPTTDTVPRSVKNCCIKATKSLLMGEEGRSKVPSNVSSYGTERANFQLRADRGLIRPWPWDERQSQYMRSLWEMRRPKGYVTV